MARGPARFSFRTCMLVHEELYPLRSEFLQTGMPTVRHSSQLTIFESIFGIWESPTPALVSHLEIYNHVAYHKTDIVDIKPANMEELTEVITAASCHPEQVQHPSLA
eukprot:762125-Hanusia_phi.AAC.3